MKALALVLIGLVIAGGGCSRAERAREEALRRSIEKELIGSFSVSASREELERVMSDKKIRFSFDPIQSRYQATFESDSSTKSAFWIWIYIDTAGRFSRVEVQSPPHYL